MFKAPETLVQFYRQNYRSKDIIEDDEGLPCLKPEYAAKIYTQKSGVYICTLF